jgi:hypothetical protein
MLGRKKTFFLDKLSFEEFLYFKENNQLLEVYNNINSILNIDLYKKDFLLKFEEFIKF